MKKLQYYILLGGLLLVFGCKKSDYLEAKPNQALVIPKSLSDFQGILDNDRIMNGSSNDGGEVGVTPHFEQDGADDGYLSANISFTFLGNQVIPGYTWSDDLYSAPLSGVMNWNYPYRVVFNANLVLDGLSKLDINASQQQTYNQVKGSALFFRAYMFYHLAQVFAPHYVASTATTDLGLPLRLSSDFNEKIQRSSVQQTYERIILDLKEAVDLLPQVPLYKTRPSRPAAEAMLAKVYLTMADYNQAFQHADNSLKLKNTLLDYNSFSATSTSPFTPLNDEVIFHSVMQRWLIMNRFQTAVDSNLYKSYHPRDLRLGLFFSPPTASAPGYHFKGSYNGSADFLFSGLAVDEVYLIRAESSARLGNTTDAMNDLNILMLKRWKNDGSFVPFTASSAADALSKILVERRKELLMRSTRWTDLRRLNKEGANITITRKLLNTGAIHTLAPNSLKYTYLIPPEVIGYNPGMQQNPR